MRLRLPSAGFCYVVLTAAAFPWFFDYLDRPMFFEHPWESRPRDVGEARYLLGLGQDSADPRRIGWLRRAHELALRRSEFELAEAARQALAAAGVAGEALGLRELSPGVAWALGLDAEGWTTGTQLATFVLHNPTAEPRRAVLHFSTGGSEDARCVTADRTEWFKLAGDGARKLGSVRAPTVSPGARVAISVGAGAAFASGEKQLGLRFERIELVP